MSYPMFQLAHPVASLCSADRITYVSVATVVTERRAIVPSGTWNPVGGVVLARSAPITQEEELGPTPTSAQSLPRLLPAPAEMCVTSPA